MSGSIEFHVGNRVRAWCLGEEFTATIKDILYGKGHASGTDLLILVRDDGEVTDRDSNAVRLL